MNKKQVALENLEAEIESLQKAEGNTITSAVLRSDVSVPSGFEKEVINRILKMGLNCGLVGHPTGKR